MPGISAAREAPLRLEVSDEPYSIPVEDPDEALRLVKEFFERVGVIKKSSDSSFKYLVTHPDGYECVVKAKITRSSKGSRLHLTKRSGDGFVFSLVFRLIREAMRLDGLPPMFFHGQIYRAAVPPPPPAQDAVMSDFELPPTRESGFYTWTTEQFLEFSMRHQVVLDRIGRGDLQVSDFNAHVEKIPRSLLESRSIAPTMFNVYETCEKISELLSDATAFWA